MKLITILFIISLFILNFYSKYLIRVLIITLIFFSGFILYQKKTAEILNMNLNKFQEYYHFNIKNEFKTKCDVTVEFYNDKKINLNFWKRFSPEFCAINIIDKKLSSKKHLIFTYEMVGYNSRVEQLSEYFENDELRNVKFYFFGLSLEEYKRLIKRIILRTIHT